jgi:glycosyltransferase involved in cell wall biosynthesis
MKEVCKNNECSIITLSPENKKSMVCEFEKFDVKIIHLNMERKTSKESYINELKRIIERINPDIVHTHGFRSDRYINLINKDYPFKHVTTLHNFPFSDYPRLYGLMPGLLLSVFHLYIIKLIKYKIACSYSIAGRLKLFAIKKIPVIQNGVDIGEFKSLNKKEKEGLRKKLNLPQNKKIIISTGAIIKRKRPIKLMKVFGDPIWEDKNVLFLVLGDGELYNQIKKYNAKNVMVLGSKSNVSEYLQLADIFISNSKAEGLPMAMLEAVSTGLNIVGSDIPSHREVRELYKDRIILYRGQDIQTIITKINEALIECDCALSTSSNHNYKISSKTMAKNYLLYYQNVLVKL